MNRLHQAGFTLIELMVAITLGLLVTAAAIQLYITSITSYNLQKAMSNIQDSTSFGINYIVRDIRLANLNAPIASINDKTAYAGILLKSNITKEKVDINCGDCFDSTPNAKLKKFKDPNNNDETKKSLENDQLLIRYQSPNDEYDCSGTLLNSGHFVIQHYFLQDGALRCAAAQYMLNSNNDELRCITNRDGRIIKSSQVGTLEKPCQLKWSGSQIIIPKVDYFAVRLGTVTGALNNPTAIRYINLSDYKNAPTIPKNINGILENVHPNINAIQIGLLVQSNETAANDINVRNRNKQPFDVLGEPVTLKEEDTRLRQVVTQTISLRNAMGWVEEGWCDTSKPDNCKKGS